MGSLINGFVGPWIVADQTHHPYPQGLEHLDLWESVKIGCPVCHKTTRRQGTMRTGEAQPVVSPQDLEMPVVRNEVPVANNDHELARYFS